MSSDRAIDADQLVSLNPGIRELVQFLRVNEFATCDSGDGKTHDHECDRPDAYVVIETEPSKLAVEADRLMCILAVDGIEVKPIGLDDAAPTIQASYDPASGIGLIDLQGVDDEMLRRGRASVGR